MAVGFFLGVNKGRIAKIMDPDGNVVEVPLHKIPKGLKPGQDFNYRASSSGNFRIAEPVSSRGRASNSARDRQQFAVQHLMKKGWTAPQAAGIVGRFMVEAFPDLRTTAVGDREIPGGSFGIGQWNRERKAALRAYATGKVEPGKFEKNPLVIAAAKSSPGSRSAGDFATQLDFFDWEIRNSPSERIAYAAVRRAKSAEDAATGMMHYERPRGYLSKSPSSGMHYSKTVKNAQSVMKAYDPHYEVKTDFAASQHDVDLATMATRDETGDLIVMEQSQGDPGFETMDDFIDDPQEEETQDSLGGLLGGGVSAVGAPETVDTSQHAADIEAMIEFGRQAESGGLPSLPRTLNDVFGRG